VTVGVTQHVCQSPACEDAAAIDRHAHDYSANRQTERQTETGREEEGVRRTDSATAVSSSSSSSSSSTGAEMLKRVSHQHKDGVFDVVVDVAVYFVSRC